MPIMRATVHDSNYKPGSDATLLAVVLSLGAAASYLVVWSLHEGNGCGPPGNTHAASTVKTAPFLLPLAAAVIFVAVGAIGCWRPSTLVWGAVATGVTSGLLEALVFWLEFVGHRCYA
jgi:hypothetical protein